MDGNVLDQPLPPHATLNILEAVNREGVDELLTMANVVMGLPVMVSWVRRALVFYLIQPQQLERVNVVEIRCRRLHRDDRAAAAAAAAACASSQIRTFNSPPRIP